MSKHTLFISDLHLQESMPGITKLFLQFLNREALGVDALYILGDLFEAWVGDDDASAFNQSIIQAIKKTSETTPVFIMQGNRDFLLGEKFTHACGASLLDDPCLLDCYDNKIVLTHGDLLCTDDKRHQRFRKFSHNKIAQSVFLSLPLSLRKKIAEKMRQTSKGHTQTITNDTMDVTDSAVKNLLEQHQTNLMIHGHTHRANIHKQHSTTRIVLDAWHDRGNYLFFPESGQYELRWFT